MINELLRKNRLVSDQIDKRELRVILQELSDTLEGRVDGDVVEFGCYAGTTALFMQRLLRNYKSTKTLHVYDSFMGLPQKSSQDSSIIGDQFTAGELKVPKQQLIKNFRQAGVSLPQIHAGWFHDIKQEDLPETISFAFLDGDFYESIRDSFSVLEGRLSPHAKIIVDDYQSESLPGVKRAVTQWLATHSAKIRIEASLAIISIV